MEDVRETRVREGPLEVVTLEVVTDTPRRRTLSESYKHILTPIGELPPVGQKRLKAESSARSRAILRLQPKQHAQQLLARKIRRDAAPRKPRHAGHQSCVPFHWIQTGSAASWKDRCAGCSNALMVHDHSHLSRLNPCRNKRRSSQCASNESASNKSASNESASNENKSALRPRRTSSALSRPPSLAARSALLALLLPHHVLGA